MIEGLIVGAITGFIIAIFMVAVGRNNMGIDIYAEGYDDGWKAAKEDMKELEDR